MFRFHYLNDAPLISVDEHPCLEGNTNGPALIEAPCWLENPPGRYLLYFAHHEGQAIRLAYSDVLTGPWRLHDPSPLKLEDSRFALEAPTQSELAEEARAFIAAGADGIYPHIASPDVWVDHDNRQIRLYYHGRMQNGVQRSRVALSSDGIHFSARDEILADSYLRIFRSDGWFYAIAMPAQLYRSRDGLSGFEKGPRLTNMPIRHHAILQLEHRCHVFWTRVGDKPERILVSTLDTSGDWQNWRLGEPDEVHRARRPWEGGDLAATASQYGAVDTRVNQLRDPAIFVKDGKIHLLYAVAGEQGIAIGELEKI